MTTAAKLAKVFWTLGVVFILIGFFFWLQPRIPALQRLGRLPGDIRYQGKHVQVYFPLVTCLVLSALLTLLASLWSRWR